MLACYRCHRYVKSDAKMDILMLQSLQNDAWLRMLWESTSTGTSTPTRYPNSGLVHLKNWYCMWNWDLSATGTDPRPVLISIRSVFGTNLHPEPVRYPEAVPILLWYLHQSVCTTDPCPVLICICVWYRKSRPMWVSIS